MRSIEEIAKALIPGTPENLWLKFRMNRPTKHPGSKRRHNERHAKIRRKMARLSRRVNRRR
jgi:hypothetical protein